MPAKRRPSLRVHAAVDREVGTRDEARIVGAKKRDERCDLVGTPETADRNLRKNSRFHDVVTRLRFVDRPRRATSDRQAIENGNRRRHAARRRLTWVNEEPGCVITVNVTPSFGDQR